MSDDDTRLDAEILLECRVEQYRRCAAKSKHGKKQYYHNLWRDMSAMVMGADLLPAIREAARRDGVWLEAKHE